MNTTATDNTTATTDHDINYYDDLDPYDMVELGRMPDAYAIPLLIVTVVSSSLSILGSTCIIVMTGRELDKSLLQRIIFCMSLSDFFYSCAFGLSAILLPSSQEVPVGTATWGSIGNFTSCSVVGFWFALFGGTGAIYNCLLSLYFLATVRYGWREDHQFTTTSTSCGGACFLKRRIPRWEVALHIGSLALPLSIGIAGLATDHFRPHETMLNCFGDVYPWGCHELPDDHPDQCPEDHRQVWILSSIMSMGILILAGTGIIATTLVFFTVRSKLKQSQQFQFQIQQQQQAANKNHDNSNTPSNNNNSSNNNSGSLSNSRRDSSDQDDSFQRRIVQVRNQAILYCITYLNTLVWFILLSTVSLSSTTLEVQIMKRTGDPGLYILLFLLGLLAPLQGAFNFMIYTRLKVQRWRKLEPNKSLVAIWKDLLWGNPMPTTSSRTQRGSR